MKKLKKLNKVVSSLITLFFALTIFQFSSCKSTPVETAFVDPLELIDNENHFFISIPYKVDPNLIVSLIEKNAYGIEHNQAEMIAKRIDTLYVGLIKAKKSATFQISGSVDFPKIAIKKVFKGKNGFSEEKIEIQQSEEVPFSYSVYSKDGTDISFPSEFVSLLGRNVPEMLNVYHGKAFSTGYENKNPIGSSVYSFLKGEDNEIPAMKFYAARPQSFLTMLTGTNLTLKLAYVRGTMKTDPKSEKQYVMDLEFEFKDARMIPVAKGALSVAFGLTDSDVYLTSPTHLVISNIKIGKEQLYRLLLI